MFGRTIVFDGAIWPTTKGETSIPLGFGATGTAYCSFSVGTYGGKDKNGGTKDKIYHRCVAFGQMAENIAESCKPGDEVIIVGTLESNNWETEDGDKRYETQVLVDMFGISLRWDPGMSHKIWADEPGEAPAKKKAKKKGKKKKSSSPDEAPF